MFGFGKASKLRREVESLREELGHLRNQGQQQITGWPTREQSPEFFGVPSASGVIVTTESAKRSAAVYACSRLIAGAIALLPLPIYERQKDGTPKAIDHDFWWLLNEAPYPTITACSWWEWMGSSMLMRGDGMTQIIRDRSGKPISFMPLPRECVEPTVREGRLAYYIYDGTKPYGLDQDDVLHFPGFGFDGVRGESVIRFAARQAVGTALSADQYSGKFFANGASPSMVITYPQGTSPTEAQQAELRRQFTERYVGPENHHLPMLLVNGGKAEAVSLTAEDAQLLETRKFQVIEIARAFGVPPHMIGETSASTSWGSGIEQMSIGFVRYTLGPHLRRIEQELNRKLWPRSGQYFTEYNREGLLAGDSKTEAEVLGKCLGGPGAQGWMTINEVRRIKNLPPLSGGDQIVMQTQKAQNEPPAAV